MRRIVDTERPGFSLAPLSGPSGRAPEPAKMSTGEISGTRATTGTILTVEPHRAHRRVILVRLKRSWRRLLPAWLGLIIVFFFLVTALLANRLAPRDPLASDLSVTFRPPSSEFPLGTDSVGRDQLSRVIYGARLSLIIGCGTVAGALSIGLALGVVAAYVGRWVDVLIMRFVDLGLAFPTVLLVLLLVTILGQGMRSLMIALTVASVFPSVRLIRSAVLTVKGEDYIQSARSVGCTDLRIVWRYILPNCLSTVIVFATFEFPRVLLTGAAFSFLGLGVEKPLPEWGSMLAEGKNYMVLAPHLSIVPGVALALLVLGFNLLGDGLRDYGDPRMRRV